MYRFVIAALILFVPMVCGCSDPAPPATGAGTPTSTSLPPAAVPATRAARSPFYGYWIGTMRGGGRTASLSLAISTAHIATGAYTRDHGKIKGLIFATVEHGGEFKATKSEPGPAERKAMDTIAVPDWPDLLDIDRPDPEWDRLESKMRQSRSLTGLKGMVALDGPRHLVGVWSETVLAAEVREGEGGKDDHEIPLRTWLVDLRRTDK